MRCTKDSTGNAVTFHPSFVVWNLFWQTIIYRPIRHFFANATVRHLTDCNSFALFLEFICHNSRQIFGIFPISRIWIQQAREESNGWFKRWKAIYKRLLGSKTKKWQLTLFMIYTHLFLASQLGEILQNVQLFGSRRLLQQTILGILRRKNVTVRDVSGACPEEFLPILQKNHLYRLLNYFHIYLEQWTGELHFY